MTGRVELPEPEPAGFRNDWWDRAACRGTSTAVFFPGKGETEQKARKFCRICPVREDCLEYALEHREEGIWGDMSDEERQYLRRRRRSKERKVA